MKLKTKSMRPTSRWLWYPRVFLLRYPRFQLASITNTENMDIGRIYTPDTQNSENINPASEAIKASVDDC